MSHYMNELFNSPIRLSKEERENPLQVLTGYAEDFELREVRQHLYRLLVLALTGPEDDFDEPTDRADLVYFYERTEQLVEAVFIISSQATKGDTPAA
jgi:hypothetical protein